MPDRVRLTTPQGTTSLTNFSYTVRDLRPLYKSRADTPIASTKEKTRAVANPVAARLALRLALRLPLRLPSPLP